MADTGGGMKLVTIPKERIRNGKYRTNNENRNKCVNQSSTSQDLSHTSVTDIKCVSHTDHGNINSVTGEDTSSMQRFIYGCDQTLQKETINDISGSLACRYLCQTSREVTSECSHPSDNDDRIDCIPSPKERAKSISQFSVKSFMYLRSMDWDMYEFFASKYNSKKYRNDVAALVAIGRADHYGNVGNPIVAMKHLDEVEKLLPSVQLPQGIMVRYLTSKAYMLKMKGKGVDSENLLCQAVQMATNEEASNATAYCISRYALVTLLHDIEPDGTVNIPDEATWKKAETFCLQACEQHQKWVQDMDDDFVVPETVTKGFFLMNFTRYVAILLRSCTGSGFGYFEHHYFPKDNLKLAAACIEKIKSMDHLLSTKDRGEFYLVECDYFLRCASIQQHFSINKAIECYEKAKTFANMAKGMIQHYKDRTMAKFHGSFPEIRLKYIDSKLNDLKQGQTEDLTNNYEENLYYSYVDYIKDGTDGKIRQIYTTQKDGTECEDDGERIDSCKISKCPYSIVHNTFQKQVVLDASLPATTSEPMIELRLDDDLQTVPK